MPDKQKNPALGQQDDLQRQLLEYVNTLNELADELYSLEQEAGSDEQRRR